MKICIVTTFDAGLSDGQHCVATENANVYERCRARFSIQEVEEDTTFTEDEVIGERKWLVDG